MKKIAKIVLFIFVFNLCSVSAYAISNDSISGEDQTEIALYQTADGNYVPVENDKNYRAYTSDAVVWVKEFMPGVYRADLDTEFIVMEAPNDVYIPAQEIKIDIASLDNIEYAVEEYDLNPRLAECLRDINVNLQENDEVAKGIEVNVYKYLQPMARDSSIRYYVGYGGLNYQDELVTVHGGHGKHVEIPELAGTLAQIGNICIRTYIGWMSKPFVIADFLYNIHATLYKTYPSTTDAVTYVVNEEPYKARKFTLVESPYYPGSYECRAISDSSHQYFRYITQVSGIDYSEDGSSAYYRGDYFLKLDEMAYKYRYGGGAEFWDETYKYVYLDNFHRFDSIIF